MTNFFNADDVKTHSTEANAIAERMLEAILAERAYLNDEERAALCAEIAAKL
jgi:hypothetical protein